MLNSTEKQPADDSVELRRSVLRLARRLRAERPSDGLSSNALSILAHLHQDGSMSPGAIAEAERQQPQSLTRVFAELERSGLILRLRSQVDQRQHILEITSKGRRALARDMVDRDAWLTKAMSELSPTERQVLRMAAGLLDQLATHGGSAE